MFRKSLHDAGRAVRSQTEEVTMKFTKVVVGVIVLMMSVAATAAAGPHVSSWGTAQKIDEVAGNSSELNTVFLDGCPIQSPDGLSLYMATNRPRFPGDTRTDLDIWVAHRASTDVPFGAPVNLGEPVNSTADDFCPTPVRGGGLFFVSWEALAGSCGLGDIYFTRRNPSGAFAEPEHLACGPVGPNGPLDEQGPSYVELDGEGFLFFSSSSAVVPGDIYVSEGGADRSFGAASPVVGLNSSGNDIQPNVRKDGLEIVFSSNHAYPGAQGAQDLYVATRGSAGDPWSTPVNLGTGVNTGAAETRPSLSWNALSLLFGRAPGPEGMADVYVSSRDKLTGSDL
jgi:hypothetical protein